MLPVLKKFNFFSIRRKVSFCRSISLGCLRSNCHMFPGVRNKACFTCATKPLWQVRLPFRGAAYCWLALICAINRSQCLSRFLSNLYINIKQDRRQLHRSDALFVQKENGMLYQIVFDFSLWYIRVAYQLNFLLEACCFGSLLLFIPKKYVLSTRIVFSSCGWL